MKQFSKFNRLIGLLLVVGLLFAALPTGQAQAVAVYDVCASGCPYTTIQAAITAATAGDTINVAAGTYNENVVVNKALTLNGAQHGVTAVGRTGEAESIIQAAIPADYVVEITATNVTLDGFTITGLAADNDTLDNSAAVITQRVDYCTITNNILTGNHVAAISLFGGVGGAYSDSNTVSNNVINGPDGFETFGIKIKGSHNTISGNHIYNADTSILVWSWDASETASPDYNIISGNTIAQGTGGTAAHKFGIEIKTGQHNTVTANTITDTTWAAIHLYTDSRNAAETSFDPRPANNTISNNTITGGATGTAIIQVGIFLQEGANTNTISGNTITGTTKAGILGSFSRWPGDWSGKYLEYTGHPTTESTDYLQIVGNTISGNTITGDGHGIAMEYADDNTLTLNKIQGNTSSTAIDYHGVTFAASAGGVYFVNSNSTDNTATSNWWGNATGPTNESNSGGSGDAISDDVEFTPWCGNAECSFLISATPGVADQDVTTAEETAVDITLVATDVEGVHLTYSIVVPPAHGTAVLADNVVTYTPALNFFGIDSFTFRAYDGTAYSTVATVTISVTPVKDDPMAVDDAYKINQDTTLVVLAADGVMKNDTDVDLNTMTTTLLTSVTHGTLTLLGDGSFTYTPAPGFFGDDTFVYQLVTYEPRLARVGGWTDEATVTITVNGDIYLPLIMK